MAKIMCRQVAKIMCRLTLNVEETIDDEYTVDEEPVLMAEGTTVATKDPLVLTQDNIESITLTYHSTVLFVTK